MKNTLVICGFKHVGKSLLASHLAVIFGVPLLDLDEIVCPQKDISHYYNMLGEEKFRKQEFIALSSLDYSKKQVLALGGGTLDFSLSKELLLTQASLIGLYSSWETLKQRILSKKEPYSLLDPKNLEESLKKLYEKREKEFRILEIPKFLSEDHSVLNTVEDYVRKYIW